MYWSTPAAQAAQRKPRVEAQKQSMKAAAAARPIQLREAMFGSQMPGGPAYGAVRGGRQVLVQPGAASSGSLNAGAINFGGQTLYPAQRGKDVIFMPAGGSKPTQIERNYGIPGTHAAVLPPPGPGQAAPTAVVTPPSRARVEALNAASQQAGGANISQPLVPKEAQDASTAFAAARDANPLVNVQEHALVDQRSAEYAQRADIQAWMKANPALAKKFLEKQRPTAVNPVQEMPAGAKLMGGDGSEQGATQLDMNAKLAGINQSVNDYNASRTGLEQELGGAAAAAQERFGAFDQRNAALGWAKSPAVWNTAGFTPSVVSGQNLEVAYQPQPAQASNLSGPNSPLNEANLNQFWSDRNKKLLANPVLARYRTAAVNFNMSQNS